MPCTEVLSVLQEKVSQAANRQLKALALGLDSGVAMPSRPSIGSISKESAGPGRPPVPGAALGSAPASERGGVQAPAPPRSEKDASPAPRLQKMQLEVDTELLLEKEQAIAELREMVGIMTEKIKKLEQLVGWGWLMGEWRGRREGAFKRS
ncbi:unnamed protein product [Symbiodinium natans]|uniref:Uncharacterized protein n=1 Tax=Symbiodinium natans TaxID=878477 RepID=A0A812UKF2_9DINO|nr:unnamed protein product [Symbiodinium natans]